MQKFYLISVISLKQVKIMENKKNENFRFFIKTQSKLGKQTIEIFNDLKAVYNDEEPLYSSVSRWVVLFKNDRTSLVQAVKMTLVQAVQLQELLETTMELFVLL